MNYLLLFALLLSLISLPASATQVTAIPSVGVTEIYDDNILLDPASQSDFVSRIRPEIVVDRSSEATSLIGRYSFTAEYYRDHPGLSSAVAGSDAEAAFSCDCFRGIHAGVEAARLYTRTAGELNAISGFQPGRVDARRRSIHPEIEYRFDPLWRSSASYTNVFDEVSAMGGMRQQDVSLGVTRGLDEGDEVSIQFGHDEFNFGGGQAEHANLLALRWLGAVTPRLQLDLGGGPRVGDDGEVEAVGHASMRFELANGYVTGGARRERSTLLGEVGTVSEGSLRGAVGMLLTRSVGFSVGGVHSNVQGDTFSARIDQATLQAWYRFNAIGSVIASFDVLKQQGTGPDVLPIRRNRIALTVVVGRPAPRAEPGLMPDARYLSAALNSARRRALVGDTNEPGDLK